MDSQPVSNIRWIDRNSIRPNDYNPNRQPPPEHRLLRVSILEDGWTQPIVVHQNSDGELIIIDGEHRWIVSGDKEIAAKTDGKVPIVEIKGDLNHRMMSTIRHNRARGEHYILSMASIVRQLLDSGMPKDDVQFLLQMEDEEIDRLAEKASLPEKHARNKSELSKSWEPK